MRQFILRALQKLHKLDQGQVKDLFVSMAGEIERLETVMDSLNEAVLVCDSECNLILANKAAERILPMRREEQGALLWSVIDDEDIAAFIEKALHSGDRVTHEEFAAEVNGKDRLLSISIFPLVKNYKVTGSLVQAEDITERRGREARMRRMESLASLTTLAAGVAHEIKNPLGSISIHMQLLKKAMKKNEELYYSSHPAEHPDINHEAYVGPNGYFNMFKKYTGVIDEEIERLNHIVVDFLFAVRPMNIDAREGDINAFIRSLAEFVKYELAEAKVDVDLNLADGLPLIEFDERLMKQALLNLVQNAVAAMPAGGVLTVTTERDLNEGGVKIIISDTGTGIPEKNLSKIFEPYFTTKENGSGLGLTLVFKIIREHQGEINVKSREGEGSSFIISLPVPQKDKRLLPTQVTEAVNEV
jgi:PAS domain S-box-containing protein